MRAHASIIAEEDGKCKASHTTQFIQPGCQRREAYTITLDEQKLVRSAVKYGRAVAHVVALYWHLASKGAGQNREVEVSRKT